MLSQNVREQNKINAQGVPKNVNKLEKHSSALETALMHMLPSSGPRGTSSRQSTMRGCISIIELSQFNIVRSFWASLGEALF